MQPTSVQFKGKCPPVNSTGSDVFPTIFQKENGPLGSYCGKGFYLKYSEDAYQRKHELYSKLAFVRGEFLLFNTITP